MRAALAFTVLAGCTSHPSPEDASTPADATQVPCMANLESGCSTLIVCPETLSTFDAGALCNVGWYRVETREKCGSFTRVTIEGECNAAVDSVVYLYDADGGLVAVGLDTATGPAYTACTPFDRDASAKCSLLETTTLCNKTCSPADAQ